MTGVPSEEEIHLTWREHRNQIIRGLERQLERAGQDATYRVQVPVERPTKVMAFDAPDAPCSYQPIQTVNFYVRRHVDYLGRVAHAIHGNDVVVEWVR